MTYRLKVLVLTLLLALAAGAQQTVGSGNIAASGNIVLNGVGTSVVLSSIAISPSNPAVCFSCPQSFTAQGTYSNSTTADLTTAATWTSSNSGIAVSQGNGAYLCGSRGSITVTATYQLVSGTTTLSCLSPTFSPQGTVNVNQSGSSVTITQFLGANGVAPYTFSSPSGLPGGWTLSSTGCPSGQVLCALVGTPSTVGVFNFTIQVTDNVSHTSPVGNVSVNVVASSGEGNNIKYCGLVGNVETVTGLSMDGPANPLPYCNYTAILTGPGATFNGLGGSPQLVYVCPKGQLNATVSVSGCFNAPQVSGHVVPVCAPAYNGTPGSQPTYCATTQSALKFVNNGGSPICGSDIQIYPTIDAADASTTQNEFMEPTNTANIPCGPAFGKPWVWMRPYTGVTGLGYNGLPAPGSRITPSWFGQAAIPGRPSYAQSPHPGWKYGPRLKCEYGTLGGNSCTYLSSQQGALLSGVRIMGMEFIAASGRDLSSDAYGNQACPNNANGTPNCSPGTFGPLVALGCQIVGNTPCTSPVTGTVNTTNSAVGLCPANCVTWQSWNSGVAGAEQYDFTMFNSNAADPILIGGTQYIVNVVYSNTLLSVIAPPSTQTGATYAPYTGGYNVVLDRDLFVGCNDLTMANCYNDMESLVNVNGGQRSSIINSYFLHATCMQSIGPCVDSHAIFGGIAELSNDLGIAILNNYVEATGEDFFFGGANSQGVPIGIEVRGNRFEKPLTWKMDNPLFPGVVYDAWVAKAGGLNPVTNAPDPYSNGTTCSVSAPINGTPATCTVSISGVTNACPGGGCILDVQITSQGSGYGLTQKGNGATVAARPGFFFTDPGNGNTYASCANNLTGSAYSTGSDLFWTRANAKPSVTGAAKFTNKLQTVFFGGALYTVTSFINSTHITLSPAPGTQGADGAGLEWDSNFASRSDCVYAEIGNWDIKNPGEFKNGVGILYEGNIVENNFNGQSDQSGQASLFTPKNAQDTCPTCQVSDVTLRYNYFTNTTMGLLIGLVPATRCSPAPCLPITLSRMSIHDNLFDGMNGTYMATGTSQVNNFAHTCAEVENVQSPAGATNYISFIHNTCIGTIPSSQGGLTGGSALELFYTPQAYGTNNTTPAMLQGIKFNDNIAAGGIKNFSVNTNGAVNCTGQSCNDHSLKGPSTAALNGMLSSYFLNPNAGGFFTGNVVTAIIEPSGLADINGSAMTRNTSGGPSFPFTSSMAGSILAIGASLSSTSPVPGFYTVASVSPPDNLTLACSGASCPGILTKTPWSTGPYHCPSDPPTQVTLTSAPGTYTTQALAGLSSTTNTSGTYISKVYPADVGAGYTVTPNVTFSGCTASGDQPPVAQAYIGGAGNATSGVWQFTNNLMPGVAWTNLVPMTPYPTLQGDGVTTGTNLGNTGNLSTWEQTGFVNFVRDSNGAECTTYAASLGITCAGGTPTATGDLHLCAGTGSPAGCAAASPGHNAADDGRDIGAYMDYVIGCDGVNYGFGSNTCVGNVITPGAASVYTGISINNGVVVLPQ